MIRRGHSRNVWGPRGDKVTGGGRYKAADASAWITLRYEVGEVSACRALG